MIINIIPKKSKLKRNRIIPAIQKAKIKNKTDSIGLVENTTNRPQENNNMHNNKCKFVINKKDIGMMRFERMASCSQNKRASNCATFRSDGNRT